MIKMQDGWDAPWPKVEDMTFPYKLQFSPDDPWYIEFADSITYEQWLETPAESIVFFHDAAMDREDRTVTVKSSKENLGWFSSSPAGLFFSSSSV